MTRLFDTVDLVMYLKADWSPVRFKHSWQLATNQHSLKALLRDTGLAFLSLFCNNNTQTAVSLKTRVNGIRVM